MDSFCRLFGRSKLVIIGMIHLRALPGSVKPSVPVPLMVEKALEECNVYKEAGVDGVMMENMHDVPWQPSDQIGPETVCAVTVACQAMRRAHPSLPMGIQILSGANMQAMAVAKVTGLNWIRAEGFVFSHIGDEGFMNSCAPHLLRYRKQIDANDALVFTDIKKKHSSHAITSDVSLTETAQAAELFGCDGVIVTGSSTAVPTDPQQVTDVQQAVEVPVLVGSGVNKDNVSKYASANAIIIGSALKSQGKWFNELDKDRVMQFMETVHKLRKS